MGCEEQQERGNSIHLEMTISSYIEKKAGEYISEMNCSSMIEEHKTILKMRLERDILFKLCEEMYNILTIAKYRFPDESDQKPMLEIVAKIETGN